MEISGLLTKGEVNGTSLNQFHLNDRLLIEVVQKTGEGKGIIRVNGQDLLALLDPASELGEKFWVKVGETNESNLVLIREPLKEIQGDIPVVSQQFQLLRERSLPISQDIISLLETFPSTTMDTLNTLLSNVQGIFTEEFKERLRKIIPEWGGLSEENGIEELVGYMRKLGLDYEQRIYNMLKLPPADMESEKNSLKATIKFALLEAIQNQEGQDGFDSTGALSGLLQKITGQQLWLKTGGLDNAYLLLHLPLLNQGQFVPVYIAIESARKGVKMDEQHCRVAVQVETQQFGVVGVDAYFDLNSLTIRVLNSDPISLPQFLDQIIPETKAKFAKLGFNLRKVEIGDLRQNTEFKNFLQGIRRSGVDLRR